MRYQCDPDVLSGQIGAEGVLMSLSVECYFALNTTAKFMWDLLEEPRTESEIAEAILHTFRVEPEECRAQTRAFLDVLVNRHLVRLIASEP